jgi:regulator of protease activity HflC (stomatin/prohibitin superfamily)
MYMQEKMKRVARSVGLLAAASILVGCAEVETGEYGLRRSMDGKILEETLEPGWHQVVVGSVLKFSGKEILLDEGDIKAQTLEKSTLQDFDISFSYDIKPTAIFELYTNYSGANHARQGDEIFLMAAFMKNLVRSAAYGSVSTIPALEANNPASREKIVASIRREIDIKLQAEGLQGKISLKALNIRDLQPASEIVASATAVVARENELVAKKKEVEIAEQEAKRIAMLNSNAKAIEYMNAQSNQMIAKGVSEGKVNAILVPYDFKGMVHMPAGTQGNR